MIHYLKGYLSFTPNSACFLIPYFTKRGSNNCFAQEVNEKGYVQFFREIFIAHYCLEMGVPADVALEPGSPAHYAARLKSGEIISGSREQLAHRLATLDFGSLGSPFFNVDAMSFIGNNQKCLAAVENAGTLFHPVEISASWIARERSMAISKDGEVEKTETSNVEYGQFVLPLSAPILAAGQKLEPSNIDLASAVRAAASLNNQGARFAEIAYLCFLFPNKKAYIFDNYIERTKLGSTALKLFYESIKHHTHLDQTILAHGISKAMSKIQTLNRPTFVYHIAMRLGFVPEVAKLVRKYLNATWTMQHVSREIEAELARQDSLRDEQL